MKTEIRPYTRGATILFSILLSQCIWKFLNVSFICFQKKESNAALANVNQAITMQRLNQQAQILGQQALLNNQILLANAAAGLDGSKLAQVRLSVPGGLVTDGKLQYFLGIHK